MKLSRISMIPILTAISLFLVAAAPLQAKEDNSAVSMDTAGAEVYIAWQDDTGAIWFAQSPDKGITFDDPMQVNSGINGSGSNPGISVDSAGNVYIIWEQSSGSSSDLYFGSLSTGSTAFTTGVIPIDAQLGQGGAQHSPSIDVTGTGTVVISWINQATATGVYWAKSTNQGASFWSIASTAIKRVDDTTESSPQYPCIRMNPSGQLSDIVWSAEKSGARSIYFNQLNNSSARVYAADIRVSDAISGASNDLPSLAVRPGSGSGSKPNLIITWEQSLGNDTNIIMDKSTDGAAWSTDIQVNDDSDPPKPQKHPKAAINTNGDIAVTWSDSRNGDWDIYVTQSIDGGISFKTNTLVNSDTGTTTQDNPALFLSPDGNDVCISWTDYRDGDGKIFNRNSIFEDSTSQSNLIPVSGGTVRAQNIPNLEKTEVNIPANVLAVPMNITITRVDNPPPFANGDTQVDKVVDFGPSGTTFTQPVTIKIPYTQNDLTTAGVADATKLKMYYYNLKTLLWERLDNSAVDSTNQLVSAQISHFSIFSLGAGGTTAAAATGGGGGGGGGGCFIATAAYGSYDDPAVKTLRAFRDQRLMTTPWGREFVKFYYIHSPKAADYIAKREHIKSAVRIMLKPLVFVAEHTVHNNGAQ